MKNNNNENNSSSFILRLIQKLQIKSNNHQLETKRAGQFKGDISFSLNSVLEIQLLGYSELQEMTPG